MQLHINYIYIVLIFVGHIGIQWPCFAKTKPMFSFEDYVERIYQRAAFKHQEKQELRQILLEAYTNPLNLNHVTHQDLAALAILSPTQLTNFFNHRSKTGPLYSKYELQAIANFDLETIYLLLPFVFVPESEGKALKPSYKSIYPNCNSYAVLNYETDFNNKKIFSKKQSMAMPLGNLDKYSLNLHIKKQPLSFGMVAHKQSGEAFVWDQATHRYGFNLWSFFMELANKTWLKKLIIGHYQVGFGQGLIMGIPIRTNHEIHSIIGTHNTGSRPYRGISRIGLRGLSITTNLNPIEATIFYANQYLDAKIEKDQTQNPYTRAIDATGKYDKATKLNKKGTVHQQAVGYTLLTRHHRQQREIGLNVLYCHYNIPIIPLPSPFSAYLFHGQRALSSSIFSQWVWKCLLFWGEIACSWLNHNTIQQPEHAYIVGSLISLSRYIDLSTALYYYSKGFYAPYGYGFKKYTTEHANEKGYYGALKITPSFAVQLYIQGHYFTTLRPKARLFKKSYGYMVTSYITYIHQRKTILWLQHKFKCLPKTQDIKKPTINPIKPIFHFTSHHIKLKLDHKCPSLWWLSLELQGNQQSSNHSLCYGYALAHTEKWQWAHVKLLCKITYFDTQGFANRIYIYEPHVLSNGLSFTPYYGHGIASLLVIFWKLSPCLQLISKYKWVYTFQNPDNYHSTTSSTSCKTQHIGSLQLKWTF